MRNETEIVISPFFTVKSHPTATTQDGTLWFDGPEDDERFSILPNWDTADHPTICSVTERVKDSSVESDDSDCAEIELYPGIFTLNDNDEPVGATCTIINTRIYEGIPTLSQYGLALLALLMLGVGLIGFRKVA